MQTPGRLTMQVPASFIRALRVSGTALSCSMQNHYRSNSKQCPCCSATRASIRKKVMKVRKVVMPDLVGDVLNAHYARSQDGAEMVPQVHDLPPCTIPSAFHYEP